MSGLCTLLLCNHRFMLKKSQLQYKLITDTNCLYKGQEAFRQVDFTFVMIAITTLLNHFVVLCSCLPEVVL